MRAASEGGDCSFSLYFVDILNTRVQVMEIQNARRNDKYELFKQSDGGRQGVYETDDLFIRRRNYGVSPPLEFADIAGKWDYSVERLCCPRPRPPPPRLPACK